MLRRLKLQLSFPAASCGERLHPSGGWLAENGPLCFKIKQLLLFFSSSPSCFIPPPPTPQPPTPFAFLLSQEGAACCVSGCWMMANHIATTLLYFCFSVWLYILFYFILFIYFCKDKRWRRFCSQTLQVLLGRKVTIGQEVVKFFSQST